MLALAATDIRKKNPENSRFHYARVVGLDGSTLGWENS